jgi:photosystem II stability/assembly factor-like uncharacterized protein
MSLVRCGRAPAATSRFRLAVAGAVILLMMIAPAGCRSIPDPVPAIAAAPALEGPFEWFRLETEPYRGKQDDIFFLTPELGWYVNGAGKIYKTTDGGLEWVEKFSSPGTFFRCIAFVDEMTGFAGNIGPGYFPNVSDATPMYQTRDGGESWTPVTSITGPPVTGLCAIEVVREPFINAGELDYKVTIFAGGRVGGPAVMMVSDDAGESWRSVDMSEECAMILDIRFIDSKVGFISAASSAAVNESNAVILRTADGGRSWTKVYQSNRPYELTWKSSFPTASTGYVTVQNYDPDRSVSRRVVAKTTDGGRSWKEIDLVDDAAVRQFGVAFISPEVGWIGTSTTGFQTTDGGMSWTPVDLGRAVNKIRLLPDGAGFVGYAIGVEVYKLVWPAAE